MSRWKLAVSFDALRAEYASLLELVRMVDGAALETSRAAAMVDWLVSSEGSYADNAFAISRILALAAGLSCSTVLRKFGCSRPETRKV
jgi:hypothetical protein